MTYEKIMLWFSLMTGIAAFAAAPTDVYLLIGQSNMAGRGDVSVEKV